MITLLSCFLSACLSTRHNKPYPKVNDSNQRFELERVSFLPPAGHGWSYNLHTLGVMSFYVEGRVENVPHSISIRINPFDWVYKTKPFEKLQQSLLDQADKENKAILNHAHKSRFREAVSAKFVIREGMRCMKMMYRDHIYNPPEEFSIGVFGGGTSLASEYICEQPNQPSYLPFITIRLYQLASSRASLMDEEYFLEPIFKSLKFKPVDPKTSPGYVRWKETYEKAQIARKENEAKAKKWKLEHPQQ